MAIPEADFEFLAGLIRDRSGLVLTREKTYLLESRLGPVARKYGFDDLAAMVAGVRGKPDEKLFDDLTEAMTTNESFFFRDSKPFELFREYVLPSVMEARQDQQHLRIWCAAASTGQEPYSIAMILREEAQKLAGWKVEMLATDLSPAVLEKAKAGLYSRFEVQRGLPIQSLLRHFKQVNEMWQIDSALRAMVRFQQQNLLEGLSRLGRFDIVFCRNVLIYFDQDTKTRVLDEVANLMIPDGALFLGGAETVLGITDRFKPVEGHRGVYSPNSEAQAAAMATG